MRKYRIVLFGLTGFGSQMLRFLIDLGMDIQQVYTRRDQFEHPYFPVRAISDIARSYDIPCNSEDSHSLTEEPDLIICSTYHRILSSGSFQRHV